MMGPVTPMVEGTHGASVTDRADDVKLRKAAAQLEGLFVQQMYKAMRDTVPQQEGIVSGGTGEELFTSLLDQHIAAETPEHWERGLAEAIYKQLRGSGTGAASTTTSAAPEDNLAVINSRMKVR